MIIRLRVILAVGALSILTAPGATAALTWGPTVNAAEQRVYTVDKFSNHYDVDEEGEPYTIGYTQVTYQVADIVFTAPWHPESPSDNVYNLHTTEGNWSISLSLSEPPWRVEPFGLGPVTFYGFDLHLDNGSWSYRFNRLGGFQDGKLYPMEFPVHDQLMPEYESVLGERAEQITNPWLGIPYEVIAPVNGGEVDTGWSYWHMIFSGKVQLEDIPVEDQYWFFSLSTAFSGDTMSARLGLGLETFRETVIIPEPSTLALAAMGLAALAICRWRRP